MMILASEQNFRCTTLEKSWIEKTTDKRSFRLVSDRFYSPFLVNLLLCKNLFKISRTFSPPPPPNRRPLARLLIWSMRKILLKMKTNNEISFLMILIEYTGWSKSHVTEKKWNISITARLNGLIFLPKIETCSHSKSIRTRSVRPFVKYHYWPQQENFTFYR
jgi:hypothetical protein